MTSVEPQQEDSTKDDDGASASAISNSVSLKPRDTGNGVMVTVTRCSLEDVDPFVEAEGKSLGLSSLSLDVLTSGEHLNMLTEEDLISQGSEKGGSGMETPDEGLSLARNLESGRDDDEQVSDGEGGPESLAAAAEDSATASRQSPSDPSRSSSSMGYLEPRPSNQLGNDSFSPKDIQRRLMEKVSSLNSEETASAPEGGAMGDEVTKPSSLHTSNSSHSLSDGCAGGGAGGTGGSGGIRPPRRLSLQGLFRRKKPPKDQSPQTLAATSTTGLILHDRPNTLPAKTPAEEHRHQRLHQQMMAAARKKELQKAKEVVKKEKKKIERDKKVAESQKAWDNILPNWDSLCHTRKVHDLWWDGLPPGVRGEVWKKAIGNDLNISPDLYVINLKRCNERLESARERSDSTASNASLSREQSVESIHLDVLRTFPTLGFFQEGGPFNETLHDVLGAYACYRPDIGYVQGMSFIAGVLLLNMEAGDAFICLANLLNRPSYLAFFKVDRVLMRPYFNTFKRLLQECLPVISSHFSNLLFNPEFYLIEWIFTIYTRSLPLDIACRVWDMFCRDGDSFLFRTALGILKLYCSDLLKLNSIEDLGHFLSKLPSSMDSEALFAQIGSIHFTVRYFKQILSQEQSKPAL